METSDLHARFLQRFAPPWTKRRQTALGLAVLALACGTVGSAVHSAEAKTVEIVAKVGDLVITNVQVDARAGLLLQQSREVREEAGKKAQSFFKDQVQSRWKKIAGSDSFRTQLREYVMGKRPQSREEQEKYVKEFVRNRQKQLQQTLQAEARNHGLKAVQGSLKKRALDDLVEENLKLYEAKRLDVMSSVDDAKKTFAAIAQRNNKTVQQFEADLRKSGIVPMTLREKLRADESWRNVIRKRFGFQLAYLESQLDQYLGESKSGGDEGGELQLDVKRIRVGSSAAGAGLVKALQEAEQLSATIDGCDGLAGAASAIPGARLEDLGQRSADAITNPVVRELLSKSSIGKPIPPQIDGGNVDVWVLCGRERVAGGGQQQRSRDADPRQKEFELLARRHLNDLKREVRVEYR